MIKVKVEKRDGKIEEYDPENIKRVVMATGLTQKDADKLVGSVNKWVKKYQGKTITSLRIRDQVLVEIQKMDEYAAKEFIDYEKYKDKNFGVKY